MDMDNDDEPQLSRDDFVRALASVLSDQQEEQADASRNFAEETYEALSHDDPIRYHVTSSGCQSLMQCLIDKQYILTNRFLQGLEQTKRWIEPASSVASDEQPSLGFLNDNPGQVLASHADLGLLYWTVSIRIPLLCLTTKNLSEASQYLGSFQPDTQQVVDDQIDDQADDSLDHPIPAMNGLQVHHDDDIEEVWAEESDPSDFEFESGHDVEQEMAQLEAWAVAAERNPTSDAATVERSAEDVALAVSALLHRATFSHLAPLVASRWHLIKANDVLQQLIMTLLIPTVERSVVLDSLPTTHWQELGTKLLGVYRDAAIHEKDSILLPSFVPFLQSMLHLEGNTIPPHTWVALSYLSSLCSSIVQDESKSNTTTRRIAASLRGNVVESCDELAALLEAATSPETRAVLPWTYMSFFEVLSLSPISTQQAQTVLNSGLFRQWLLFWKDCQGPTKVAIESTVLQMSISSPTLFGKYAWRFPDFAVTVSVDNLLWQLMGIQLADKQLSAVRWKSGALSGGGQMTAGECQQRAWDHFEAICSSVMQILQVWKTDRNYKLESTIETDQEVGIRCVEQIIELADNLSNSTLADLFVQIVPQKLQSGEAQQLIKDQIRPMQEVLRELPVVDSSDDQSKMKTDDDMEGSELDRPPRSKMKQACRHEMVSKLRRSLKIIQSSLDGSDRISASSKAD